MEIKVQRSSSVGAAANAVYTFPDGQQVALLFLRAGDAEALKALTGVYQAYGAPMVSMSDEVPRIDQTSGNCRIREDGIALTLDAVDPSAENGGRGVLGVEMTLPWGPTDPDWRHAAMDERCVWAGLLSEEAYQRVCLANPAIVDGVPVPGVHLSEVPPMRVLRLTACLE